MKYGRMFVLMALSAIMVIAATGCGKENNGKEETANSDALIGKWISYFDVPHTTDVSTDTLQFNKDGKGVQSSSSGAGEDTFTWTLKGTALTLVMEGENVLATFDGEEIVFNIDARYWYLYMKESDEGLGEEANRKNLIGTWIGNVRYGGVTHKITYVFGGDGKGTCKYETTYDDGRPSETESEPFTWTITGAKLEIKCSKNVEATCYNGKEVLYLKESKFTKK